MNNRKKQKIPFLTVMLCSILKRNVCLKKKSLIIINKNDFIF